MTQHQNWLIRISIKQRLTQLTTSQKITLIRYLTNLFLLFVTWSTSVHLTYNSSATSRLRKYRTKKPFLNQSGSKMKEFVGAHVIIISKHGEINVVSKNMLINLAKTKLVACKNKSITYKVISWKIVKHIVYCTFSFTIFIKGRKIDIW